MIRNFINTSLGDGARIELPEKTKKVYNILGDYPETIANFMVGELPTTYRSGGFKFRALTLIEKFNI